jgi:serine/threonine protein phosphatase 1
MPWPVAVDYPVIAIADLHGQCARLGQLLDRLQRLPEWPRCAVVFLGDFVARGPDVRGTVDLVLDLAARHPVVTAVMGNHDLALVRAAQLDGRTRSAYWVEGYRTRYDHEETFQSYLHRLPQYDAWDEDLMVLREAIPAAHRDLLASLPWLVEAEGHLFLHNGLSPELEQSAEEQLDALRRKRWDNSLTPRPGTLTSALWQMEYPVWLGADKRLAARPLPAPGRVQVTGHKPVDRPEVDAIRIRLDTTGGRGGPLTACLLRAAGAAPEFLPGDEVQHANSHLSTRR